MLHPSNDPAAVGSHLACGVGGLRRREGEPLTDREAAVPVAATNHRKFDELVH